MNIIKFLGASIITGFLGLFGLGTNIQNTPNPTPLTAQKEVYIFVDNTTYNALTSKINRLSTDITSDLGAKVIIEHDNYSSPVPIRTVLQQAYNQNELLGSILIGNIPTFTGPVSILTGTNFYTDWFYSDLNDSCPIDSAGNFSESADCNSLNAFSKADVFEGRITPPVNATSSVSLIGAYLDKDHAYRMGQITFPKKMLLYPSVAILQTNNGTIGNKNSLPVNVASSIASQSRYAPEDVTTIYDTNYTQQRQDYLNDLKNNRYETAMIDIHGAPDGQLPDQSYDANEITSADIASANPNILYVELLSCSNGAFESPNYIAGEFLFNGDTLLVTANTEETAITGFLEDPPLVPVWFLPLSFLNSSAPFGELFIHNTSPYITQYFGDPTLHMPKLATSSSQLQIGQTTLNFGSIPAGSSTQSLVESVPVKNISQSTTSLLIYPDWGLTVNNISNSDYLPSDPQLELVTEGFNLIPAGTGVYTSLLIPPGKSMNLSFAFSPSVYYNPAVGPSSIVPINGKYFDSYSFLTSDPVNPFIDVNVTAQQEGTTTSPTPPATTTPPSNPPPTNPVLNISSLTPTSGAPGNVVTINGSNFDQSSIVVWNGSNGTTINPSSLASDGTSLTFVVPNVSTGTYTIQVSLQEKGGGTSNSMNFTVTGNTSPSTPSITSISPTSATAGQFIVIHGSGFDSNSYISWSGPSTQATGAIVTPPNSMSPISLSFTIPANTIAGNYMIQVVEEEKGYAPDSNIVPFTVTSSPTNPPITGMQTYQGNGLSFQYPASLNNSYASLENLPPEVIITAAGNNNVIDSNGCYKTIAASGAPGVGTQITVNNIQFCQTNDMSPAAGTLSGHYYFTTQHNGEYITLGYLIGALSCGVSYGGPNYQSCLTDQNSFNTTGIQLLQQSAGTLTFTN